MLEKKETMSLFNFPPIIEAAMGRRLFRCPRFLSAKTPYLKNLYDSLSAFHPVRDVIVMKGAALGFSSCSVYPELGYIKVDGMSLTTGQWIIEAEKQLNATIHP